MGDSTLPQQKYAGTGENSNIVITVICYNVIQTFWDFSCTLFGFVSTQSLILRTTKKNEKFKNIPKFSV